MNFWSKSVKMLEQNIMIQMHLLSAQILCMVFIRILMSTTQTEKENFNYVWWHDWKYYDK